MRVLLNVAHSADTPGKRSPNGAFKEYEFSEAVCHLISKDLTESGIANTIIYQDDAKGLGRVVEAVNSYAHLEDCILVSVHVNAAGFGKNWMSCRGWSAYCAPGAVGGGKLAECMYKAAEPILRKADLRLRKFGKKNGGAFEADFYVLNRTSCPAVLTENLFMDNPADYAWLMRKDAAKIIAAIHTKGIKLYIAAYGN